MKLFRLTVINASPGYNFCRLNSVVNIPKGEHLIAWGNDVNREPRVRPEWGESAILNNI